MSQAIVWKLFLLTMVVSLVVACAPAAVPTAIPTKAPVAPPAMAPTAVAPTATVAVVATPKPVAPTATPAPKIKRGGTIVYSWDSECTGWDPIMLESGPEVSFVTVGEALLRYNELDETTGKGEYGGQLAESWQIVDPLTIIFKLRKGVKFHDGSDFNAEVAKWVIERAKTHPKSVVKPWAAFVKSLEVVDDFTLKVNLAFPTALVFANLTAVGGGSGSGWGIMISKVAAEKFGEDYYRNNFAGTGPVMLTQHLRGDKIVTKKWEGYWRKGVDGQPLPYYDGITQRLLADAAVILAELKTGNIHLSTRIEPFQYGVVKSSPELVLKIRPWVPMRFFFGFNQYSGPFANNLKLRQAAQYAVDRKSIADVLGFGAFEPTSHIYWVPTFPGWDETLPRYEYNLEKAKALIKEAGYPNGLDSSLTTYATMMYKQPAEMIQSQWDKIGLRIKIETFDRTSAKLKLKNLEFETAYFTMSASLDPGHYNRGLMCEGTANWSSYCSKDLDKCMAEGESLYDFDKRSEVYKRCQRIIYDDALLGATHWKPFPVAQRKELKGVKFQVDQTDFQEAWLDK